MPYYQDIFGLRTTFLLGDFSLSGIGHARDLVSLFQWNLDEGMNCAAAARVPLLDDDTIWTLYRRHQDAGIEGLVRRFGLPTKRDLTGAVGALGQRDIAAGPRARLAGSLIGIRHCVPGPVQSGITSATRSPTNFGLIDPENFRVHELTRYMLAAGQWIVASRAPRPQLEEA